METAQVEQLIKKEFRDKLDEVEDSLTANEKERASDIISQMGALYYKKYKGDSDSPEIYDRAIENYRNALHELVEGTQLAMYDATLDYIGQVSGKILSELGTQLVNSFINNIRSK